MRGRPSRKVSRLGGINSNRRSKVPNPEDVTLEELKKRVAAIETQLGTAIFDLELQNALPLSRMNDAKLQALGHLDNAVAFCKRAVNSIERMEKSKGNGV